MDKIKLGSTRVPSERNSTTATYIATDWKKVPVNHVGDPTSYYQSNAITNKNKYKSGK